MRAYEFLHEFVRQFVPMDDGARTELLGESMKDYRKFIDEARIKEANNLTALRYNFEHKDDADFKPMQVKPVDVTDKAAYYGEKWYVRYLFQVLFIILVPIAKRYFESDGMEETDEMDDDLEEYLRYRRLKKKM